MGCWKFKKGFSILELIVVIILIGIMAALALPTINGLLERSRAREAINMLGAIYGSEQRFFQDSPDATYTNNAGARLLDIDPIPGLTNFGTPQFLPAGNANPTSLYFQRNAAANNYRIHITLGGATSGQIRCSNTVGSPGAFGAGQCPNIGFDGAGAAVPGRLIQ